MKKLAILFIVLIGMGVWAIIIHVVSGDKKSVTSTSNSYSGPVSPPPKVPTPEETLVLNVIDSEAAGFGAMLKIAFSIENKGEKDVKDIELACTLYGASGTKLGEPSKTLYQVIKAHQKKTIKHFNMGFAHSQTDRYSCYIKRASY